MMATKNVAFLMIFAILSGCNDVENLLKFNINDQTSFTIQSTSLLNVPLEIPTPDVTSNSQQQYENNHTHVNLVKDVRLEQLKLSITNPVSKKFSFLKSIRIFISSDQNTEMELAKLENIPADVNTLFLVPTKENLDKYIKASSYNLRTEVITHETLTESVDILVDLKFQLTADTF